MYGVIGDLQTPFYFDVNSRNGIVTIKNNLRLDNAQTYIVRYLIPYRNEYCTDVS